MVDIRICMIKGTVRYGVKWLHFKNIVSRRFYRKGFYNGCETARKLNKEGMFCGREFGEQLCGRRCYEHILTKRGIYDTIQAKKAPIKPSGTARRKSALCMRGSKNVLQVLRAGIARRRRVLPALREGAGG